MTNDNFSLLDVLGQITARENQTLSDLERIAENNLIPEADLEAIREKSNKILTDVAEITAREYEGGFDESHS